MGAGRRGVGGERVIPARLDELVDAVEGGGQEEGGRGGVGLRGGREIEEGRDVAIGGGEEGLEVFFGGLAHDGGESLGQVGAGRLKVQSTMRGQG